MRLSKENSIREVLDLARFAFTRKSFFSFIKRKRARKAIVGSVCNKDTLEIKSDLGIALK